MSKRSVRRSREYHFDKSHTFFMGLSEQYVQGTYSITEYSDNVSLQYYLFDDDEGAICSVIYKMDDEGTIYNCRQQIMDNDALQKFQRTVKQDKVKAYLMGVFAVEEEIAEVTANVFIRNKPK